MKKLLVVAFMSIATLGSINAQEGVLNGGFNIGLPTGDYSDISSLTIGAELNYMFPVSEGFTLGPSIQYSHFFGKEFNGVDIDDSSFLPISAAARFNISPMFVLGANLGYAVGLSPDGNEGGFYYRPVLGYKIGETTQLNLSYAGISRDGASADNISIGVMFGI